MATQQDGAAPARWDPRGGALDAETRQQVAELNLRAIGVLVEALAAAPADLVPVLAGAAGGAAAPVRGQASPSGPAAQLRRPPVSGKTLPAASSAASARPAAPAALTAATMRAVGGAPTPAEAAGPLPRAVFGNAAAWRSLGERGQQSLAAAPFLLLELQVARLLARREPAPARVSESRVEPRVESPVVVVPETVGWNDLGRAVFQYAWHLARVAPVLAGFVLGLRQVEVEGLRKLGLSRVDALAPAAASCLRLRWEDDAGFWADWLAGACRGDAAALWSCQLRGLQRIAGDCRCDPAA